VVLLPYPLLMPMTYQVHYNDLVYYEARTDPDGPAMTYALLFLSLSLLRSSLSPLSHLTRAPGTECTQYRGWLLDSPKMQQLFSLTLMLILNNLLVFGPKLLQVKTWGKREGKKSIPSSLLPLIPSPPCSYLSVNCRRNNKLHHRCRRLLASRVGRLRGDQDLGEWAGVQTRAPHKRHVHETETIPIFRFMAWYPSASLPHFFFFFF
jgi:hypothetical protein